LHFRFDGGLSTTFWRGVDAVFLVFDVTREYTFDSLCHWKSGFLEQVVQEEWGDDCPFLVIANKVDRDDRVVSIRAGLRESRKGKGKNIPSNSPEGHSFDAS
jgi:GTPase SAR1 family protein